MRVPPGTQVTGPATRAMTLVVAGHRAVVAVGGPGGRGNKHFATPTRQAPRFAERGLPGDEGWIELALKLLADVGLVGLPNAGKSSLLARLTRAAPKVADYPFTTLEPVLGTLELDDRQLVIADIPGLIEGASDGAGLGHDFLAHVERTRLLVHVLDLAPLDGSDPVANHATIESELERHDPRLASLPRILALSKSDLVTPADGEAARAAWQARLGQAVSVLLTSSATGAGLDELAAALIRAVPVAEPAAPSAQPLPAAEELAEHMVFRPGADRAFAGRALRRGRLPRERSRHRAPRGPLRPRQRGGARSPGGAPARDRRGRCAGGGRLRARRRRRDRRGRVRARPGSTDLEATPLLTPRKAVWGIMGGRRVRRSDR